MLKQIDFEGRKVSLERRRYSNATFCWAYLHVGEEFIQLGDPWQSINPPKAELRREIQRIETERNKP